MILPTKKKIDKRHQNLDINQLGGVNGGGAGNVTDFAAVTELLSGASAWTLLLAAELLFNFTAEITQLEGDEKILEGEINLNHLYMKLLASNYDIHHCQIFNPKINLATLTCASANM